MAFREPLLDGGIAADALFWVQSPPYHGVGTVRPHQIPAGHLLSADQSHPISLRQTFHGYDLPVDALAGDHIQQPRIELLPVHVQIGALIVPHQSGLQIDGLDGEDLRVHQNVLREGDIVPGQRALGILREESAARLGQITAVNDGTAHGAGQQPSQCGTGRAAADDDEIKIHRDAVTCSLGKRPSFWRSTPRRSRRWSPE